VKRGIVSSRLEFVAPRKVLVRGSGGDVGSGLLGLLGLLLLRRVVRGLLGDDSGLGDGLGDGHNLGVLVLGGGDAEHLTDVDVVAVGVDLRVVVPEGGGVDVSSLGDGGAGAEVGKGREKKLVGTLRMVWMVRGRKTATHSPFWTL
jgi:hypothetical protein